MSALEKLESPYLEGELQFVIPPNELSNKLAHALTESPFANLLVSLRAAESGAGLGERELEDWPAGEEAAEWAMEWAADEGEIPATTPFNPPWAPAGAEESQGEAAVEHDTPPMTQAISNAVDQKDWPRVLELAMQVGWRDENQLTNLLFFSRHTELDRRKLDPRKNKDDRRLTQEWSEILVKEVRPAIRKAAEDRDLKVSGSFVAERDPELSGAEGKKFKEMVVWAAKEVDMDPGFLAAVLLAEVGRASPYLSPGEVSSFVTGTDDFFAQRAQLRDNVPAFAQVRFDERKKTTNTNEHGRTVTTIPYKTGRDAALATAVYLKYGEIKLRRAAQKNGGNFDGLPLATRFVLVRIAMAAGHGGISPDGDLIRFKRSAGKLRRVKPGETGGILLGVARSFDRVLKGEDILVRNWEPRKNPTNDSRITHRNATILASQAMHLGDWFFRAAALGIQPELEESEGRPYLEEDAAGDGGERQGEESDALDEAEIIGTDDRVHVADTRVVPWRWVCALDLPVDDPGASRGSGVLVGPRHLLTAAHVLPRGDPDKLAKVRISPARNGDNADHPFGAYSIRRVRYPWRNVDLALVTLDRELPAALGFWGHDPARAQLRALARDDLIDKSVTVSGYPGDRCNTDRIDGTARQKQNGMRQCMKDSPRRWASTLWRAHGTARVPPAQPFVFYDADTYKGQSGGPVALSDGGVHVCVGIHINGTTQSNWGVRLTPAILGDVRDAINADARAAIASVVGDALVVQAAAPRREAFSGEDEALPLPAPLPELEGFEEVVVPAAAR